MEPVYRALPGGALDTDRRFYDSVASHPGRHTVDSFDIEPRSARAWEVPAGHLTRISVIDGPQVGDLNVWNLHNPRERFWASRTRQLQRASVTTYDRLWSTLPYLRPLMTVTSDSLAGYSDPEGTNMHDLLGSRCDPYVNYLLTGTDFDFHCHSNLTRAIRDRGLTEFDVHDVLNVFQASGLNEYTEYSTKPCPAVAGDHLEFFAEVDVLCALSTCPGGDQSLAMWGSAAASMEEQAEHCHSLRVEVIELPSDALSEWAEPQPPAYRSSGGRHGLRAEDHGHLRRIIGFN